MNTMQRMLTASTLLLFGSIMYACGGGRSMAGGTLTQADFDKMLASSSAFAALQASQAALQNNQKADEATISRIAAFGHAPGAAEDGRNALNYDQHTRITLQAVTYGSCSDMGQLIGHSTPDTLNATVENFRQCVINGAQYEYGAVVETGAIAQPFAIWFVGANCTGNMIEFEDDGGYNRQVLQDGVVFKSPIDASILMVNAGQGGQSMTAQSNFDGGSCNNATETHTGYAVSANDVSTTGVPSSVPANFIL